MTPKQEERIRDKISKIKKALAADKRQWGGIYHDGPGLRYLPPELFLKLKDYIFLIREFNNTSDILEPSRYQEFFFSKS